MNPRRAISSTPDWARHSKSSSVPSPQPEGILHQNTTKTSTLPLGHSLFPARIDERDCRSTETDMTASYLRLQWRRWVIHTKDNTPHSIRSASSTFAAHLGLTDTEIKVHANRSKHLNRIRGLYLKPVAQETSGTKLVSALFSFTAEIAYFSYFRLLEERRDTCFRKKKKEQGARERSQVLEPLVYLSILRRDNYDEWVTYVHQYYSNFEVLHSWSKRKK